MKKYYITNEIVEYNLTDIGEGDTIVFEMPPFCSGDYSAKVYKDDIGLYIDHEDKFFEGCRDFSIRKK